jgi:hypothetical protein
MPAIEGAKREWGIPPRFLDEEWMLGAVDWPDSSGSTPPALHSCSARSASANRASNSAWSSSGATSPRRTGDRASTPADSTARARSRASRPSS